MRKSVLASIAVVAAQALWTGPAFALAGGQIDTFSDGDLDGWFAGGLGLGVIPPAPPHVITSGGPGGAGDGYLRIAGLGGVGAGSRLVAINASQWSGNYLTSGISAIAMDLRNLGRTELTVRLLFEDPMGGPPLDEAVTTFGAVLPVGDAWTHVIFPISVAGLTAIDGDPAAALANATLLRIIHSPSADAAVPVEGLLGVDNILAVPEPGNWALTSLALAALAFVRRRPGKA